MKSCQTISLIKDLDIDVEGLLTTAYQTTSEGVEKLKTKLTGLVPPELIDNLTTINPLLGTTSDLISNFSDMVGGLAENAANQLGVSLDEVAAGRPDTSPDTNAPIAKDFISRPGMPVQKFLANDLVIGGTNLLNNLGSNTNNNVNGDINLNVGGKIDLSVDGRNLPQNITSEQLANEIVNNPTFTSKLMTIFTDSNNTYSA